MFIGTDGFLRSLISRLELDLAMTTASLGALRIDPSLRNKVADALVPTSKIKVSPQVEIGHHF